MQLGNKLHKDDKALATARGGSLNQKKYSDSIDTIIINKFEFTNK